MAEVFPVIIPSRGRPDPCPTAARLDEAGVAFTLWVEPSEQEAYRARWGAGRVHVIPESNRGLPYVRNLILADLRANRHGWVWMLDDDITAFYRVSAGKCHRADADAVLLGAQEVFSGRDDVAQAALEYQQFAWSARRATAENGYCDVAVCLHADRLGMARCREQVDVKLDRDLTLQFLAAGWNTVRTCGWAFSCPKNGTNQGGLFDVYAEAGREAAASRRMEQLWGREICQAVTKPDGRPDCKINWRHFQRSRTAPVR